LLSREVLSGMTYGVQKLVDIAMAGKLDELL